MPALWFYLLVYTSAQRGRPSGFKSKMVTRGNWKQQWPAGIDNGSSKTNNECVKAAGGRRLKQRQRSRQWKETFCCRETQKDTGYFNPATRTMGGSRPSSFCNAPKLLTHQYLLWVMSAGPVWGNLLRKASDPSIWEMLDVWGPQSPLKPSRVESSALSIGKIRLTTQGQHYFTQKECADSELKATNYPVFRQNCQL